MSKTNAVPWFRIESSRDEPTWGELARSGESASVSDEAQTAWEALGKPLWRLRDTWTPAVPDDVGMRDWRDQAQEPVLLSVAQDFRTSHPAQWAAVEATLLEDQEYRELRERIDAIEELHAQRDALEMAARGERPVPEGIAWIQRGGRKTLDPYVDIFGSPVSVAIVDSRFTAALSEAALTDGWRTEALEVRDRRGAPRETHRLLVVEQVVAASVEAAASLTLATAGASPIAYLVDEAGDIPREIVVTGDVVDALTAAKVPGLSFEDVPHAVPVKR